MDRPAQRRCATFIWRSGSRILMCLAAVTARGRSVAVQADVRFARRDDSDPI
jgi:hypothetical protein